MLVRQVYGGPAFIALDSTYTAIDTLRAAAGYETDEHELTMLANGHYFLIGRRESRVDMSRYVTGGQRNATVRETVIQEFTPEGDLIFLWRSWDNYDIRDMQMEDIREAYIRFPHLNSISIDEDGHILVSARHLFEVTKIDRDTGEIIWRLGGANNQFRWVDDPLNGFSAQHDFRALGDNRYTVFDNGNSHAIPESRAVEYEIDPEQGTATLVWQYRHEPRRFTPWMGNAQRLPNGNTQINYADGSLPKIVEVRPDGTKTLEMDFVNESNCYRAFKFNWRGIASKPYLIVQNSSQRVTLIYNKFGDPDIGHYNIYSGLSPSNLDVIATPADPFIHLTELQNGVLHYFMVTAVSSSGAESAPSEVVSARVHFIEPGANMVLNGGFESGTAHWGFDTSGPAAASVLVNADRQLRLHISDGGTEYWHVQLRQGNVPLIEGHDYRFEFDAYADESGIVEAKVERESDPWTNYGRIGLTRLTTRISHFEYDFTMEGPSDFSARVVFNAGGADRDVFVDNVSLKEMPQSTLNLNETPSRGEVALHPIFPNPFTRMTHIPYHLPAAGHVTIRLFNVLGQLSATLVDERQPAGANSFTFEAAGFPSGLYGVRVDFADESGRSTATGQMVYLSN